MGKPRKKVFLGGCIVEALLARFSTYQLNQSDFELFLQKQIKGRLGLTAKVKLEKLMMVSDRCYVTLPKHQNSSKTVRELKKLFGNSNDDEFTENMIEYFFGQGSFQSIHIINEAEYNVLIHVPLN